MTSGHPMEQVMLEAVALARRYRFMTAPNPNVGAVLVREGVIVARGAHKAAGLPHAEREALADAAARGIDPAGCTLVVTLEPCLHHGRTPPCTEAILAAGIRHVVIGAMDPTSLAGGGAELLRQHGVHVETGVALEECLELIRDFLTWQNSPYPFTTLKLAATLDGRIATRTGHARWISCPEARRQVHALRRVSDAVLVGGNTFYQDNPGLDYRPEPGDPAAEKQPLAVVASSRLPDAHQDMILLKKRPEQLVFWTTVASAASPKAERLRKAGARVYGLQSKPGPVDAKGHAMRAELDLAEGLRLLRHDLECRYVLCEGGGRLGLSLLTGGLAQELHLHLSPRILGDNQAIPLFDGLSPLQLDEGLRLRLLETRRCGSDLLITLGPEHPADSDVAAEAPRPCTEELRTKESNRFLEAADSKDGL